MCPRNDKAFYAKCQFSQKEELALQCKNPKITGRNYHVIMSILNHFFDYKPEVLALDEKAMELCQPYFRQMEEIRDFNQLKMLKAFADTQMSSTDMLGTTGYGLWDTGRAKLEQIFAQVMGAEDALVRSQFQSGTHTLAVALFGLLRAGDTLLAATGRPYDTLEGVIGLDGKGKVLSCKCLSQGSADMTSLSIRQVVENALLSGAAGVVLGHNHPSGVALPSAEDRAATLQVRDALATMDIRLLDHIIVADGDFVSMEASGLLYG